MQKKVLVISYNTFPVEEVQNVEGTGLRYWRIACALKSAGSQVDLAVLDRNKPNIDEYDGIKIRSFSFNYEELDQLLSNYDVIIFSYAFGQLTKEIIDKSPENAILITDAISPYYVEALTKSKDSLQDSEIMRFYKDQVEYCNYALVNSDYIMVAAEKQKELYTGVLAGMGLLDEFETNRFILTPAYPELNNRIVNKTNNSKINILWFGGMYPWFDPENLLEIFSSGKLKKIATLTVVGGSNPFYPKKDKRFNGAFDDFKKQSDQLGLTDKTIFFKDWVGYDERINIFNSADLAVSINADNLENKYSFRLRLADMVGNGVPVVTNGGDPLGENLANRNLVFKFNFLDDKDLAIRFEKFIITNKNNIMELRKKLNNAEIRNSLSSTSAVISLLDVINSGTKTQYKYNKIILINKLFNLNYNNKNLSSEIEELQNKLIILENERLSLNRDLENLKMLSDEKSKTNNLLDHELSIIYRRPWIYVWKLIKRTFRLS
jgi:hypothetical protein